MLMADEESTIRLLNPSRVRGMTFVTEVLLLRCPFMVSLLVAGCRCCCSAKTDKCLDDARADIYYSLKSSGSGLFTTSSKHAQSVDIIDMTARTTRWGVWSECCRRHMMPCVPTAEMITHCAKAAPRVLDGRSS